MPKKNHFPMRVIAFDADGIQRNVTCIEDIAALAQEKAERYNDDESRRFLSELESPVDDGEPAEEKKIVPGAKAKELAAKPAGKAKAAK